MHTPCHVRMAPTGATVRRTLPCQRIARHDPKRTGVRKYRPMCRGVSTPVTLVVKGLFVLAKQVLNALERHFVVNRLRTEEV